MFNYRKLYGFLIMNIFIGGTLAYGNNDNNQSILATSSLRKGSVGEVFQRIKKTLPDQSRKCSIIVTDIKLLLKNNDNFIAEDWTVVIGQETKRYYVVGSRLKGVNFISATPKEEEFAREKEMWDAVKKDGKEESWRKVLPYADEIEAMERAEKDKAPTANTGAGIGHEATGSR